MTLREMRTADPREFQRRYEAWYTNHLDYDWWDCALADFRERMAPLGFDVENIHFSLGYCQSDYAVATGRLNTATWMRSTPYAETHLPLLLDFEEYGAYLKVSSNSGVQCSLDYEPGNTSPTGVFADLPHAAWDELVSTQFAAEDWEELATEWVKEQCSELYDQLQEEYEYLTSEDEFIEWSEAND
jgi:hypothetical protein